MYLVYNVDQINQLWLTYLSLIKTTEGVLKYSFEEWSKKMVQKIALKLYMNTKIALINQSKVIFCLSNYIYN